MDLPEIIYRKSAPLLTISLNRPDIKNAFTLTMMDSLHQAFLAAKHDQDVKVIILTGSGGAFCSGGNIKDMADGKLVSWDMKHYLWDHIQRIPLLLEDIDKPVIAAIDGPAYGGGFDLALACDLRMASERATFCSTFVRIGLAPGDGGAYFLPRLVGLSRALDILLTGRVIKMDEALKLGLVHRVIAREKLAQGVEKYAMEIAQWPLVAIQAIKRAVYHGLKSDLRGHLDYISSQLALLSETEEHRSAVKDLTGRNSEGKK
ncbi:MAG: enoyl-CoA hydratase/isomerase family protein [Deltaproteobacteria bacterium]|nr:enoyl-CoA hydratase/isomerase family protein [Deltaproteobacteria bacterium]